MRSPEHLLWPPRQVLHISAVGILEIQAYFLFLENSHCLDLKVIPSLTLTVFISLIFLGPRVLFHYHFYEMRKMNGAKERLKPRAFEYQFLEMISSLLIYLKHTKNLPT